MLFSESTQAFYLPEVNYGVDLPKDVIEISDNEYQRLYKAVNECRRVYINNQGIEISEKRPDKYYEWDLSSNSWELSEENKIKKERDIINERFQIKQYLMEKASNKVTPLQDAVDLGIATEQEKETLNKWKSYRVALNRLPVNASDIIEWPQPPEL
ncbi:tail fiber assembly protein [Klebsiella pneumoniae]